MIKPQKKYFEFLQKHTNIRVESIQYDNIENCRKKVANVTSTFKKTGLDIVSGFKQIMHWLEQNTP